MRKWQILMALSQGCHQIAYGHARAAHFFTTLGNDFQVKASNARAMHSSRDLRDVTDSLIASTDVMLGRR
jgi:hypothetical protein